MSDKPQFVALPFHERNSYSDPPAQISRTEAVNRLDYKQFTEGHRPHIHPPGANLFVTYRLAGSIPTAIVREYKAKKDWFKDQVQRVRRMAHDHELRDLKTVVEKFDRQWAIKFETILHQAKIGPMWMKNEKVADAVAESLHKLDGDAYRLDSYSVMSNHVHVVFKPLLCEANLCESFDEEGHTIFLSDHPGLSRIMHSLKGSSARQCNLILSRRGQFWEHESFDHNYEHLGAKSFCKHYDKLKFVGHLSRFAIFVVLLFFLSTLGISERPVTAVTPQAEDSVPSIRQRYATINRNVRKYRKVRKELSGFSTEGGELTAYFDEPNIMKIVTIFYGETGKAVEEYYYWDGKLIFVYRKESRYTKPFSGRVVATTKNRFYFSNDKLIKWISESVKQVAADTSDYQEKQKEYLDSSRQFTEGARSSKSVIESSQ